MTFGSLFAGIGGFDLGFERAGMTCKWQVEIDDYARRVLARHWPDVRRHDDVRTFPPEPIDDWRVDVICGGFPCQDISPCGTKLGLDGERSGLWREYARIVRVLMPRFVVVENSSEIVGRGLDVVLKDLAACGYDAEWQVLSACMFGAPHARERLFLVAYPNESSLRTSRTAEGKAASTRLHECGVSSARRLENWWSIQPEPCSVAYGVPGIVDRLRGFGNAVVPQVAEYVGRCIMQASEVSG